MVRRKPMTMTGSLVIITETVAAVVPGADCAAVVIAAPDGTLGTRAAHGALPGAVIDLHNKTGQGPCLDAVMPATQIWIRDIRDEYRWPLFRSRAAEIGALSMLFAPMTAGPAVIGSLCLTSGTAGALDD